MICPQCHKRRLDPAEDFCERCAESIDRATIDRARRLLAREGFSIHETDWGAGPLLLVTIHEGLQSAVILHESVRGTYRFSWFDPKDGVSERWPAVGTAEELLGTLQRLRIKGVAE